MKKLWTAEVAQLHLPERAAGKPSLDAVVGRAWVRAQAGGHTADMIAWSEEGEDRFWISQSYSAETRSRAPLPASVVAAVEGTLAARPAPSLPPLSEPLACLDIFAGCGGLSQVGSTAFSSALL